MSGQRDTQIQVENSGARNKTLSHRDVIQIGHSRLKTHRGHMIYVLNVAQPETSGVGDDHLIEIMSNAFYVL